MAPAMMHSPAATPVHGLAATASDYEVVRQIEKMHRPNGEKIDAMYILNIAKDILDECKNNIPPTQEEGGDNTKLTPELQFEVNRLSIQLSHRSLEGGDDVHKKTITLLNMLSSYSWEVKVALILAAYVSNYGEYWLLAQTYRDQDPIAMNMVALLQMSNLLKDDNNQLETLFKPLENLVNSVLDLCGCIVEVKEFLSSGYASSNPAEFARFRAIIIICSYWIIRCCVICTSYMHSLIVKDPSRTTSMDEVLKTLAGKIEPLHNHLQKQLLICYQKLDAKDKIEALGRVLRTNHIDNMNVLKLLFDAMDDKPTPIFDVSNKKSVSLETMKNKTVLLLISNTDLELPFLQEWHEKCNQAQRNQHEIIFIPITESPVDTKKKTLTMPFYIVDDPRSIDPTVIRFVKEKLSFQEEPILVALGTQGRIVHPNAMPMVWTWGPKAFPLTTENEESLRKSETWKLEMLINDLDDTLIKMAQEGKSICLYGGDNLEWIRMFAAKAKEVANSLSVPLEMFFLGKSTDNLPKLKKIMSNIYSEKLVSTIPELDSTKVRSLWAHLERILLSRAQYLKRTKQNSVAEDGVLQGWEKLLDKSGRRGWALFSKGNDIALIGDEDVTMTALNEIDKWKGNVKQNGFEGALKDYYEMLQGGPSDRPCCRLHFQDGRSDEILESLTCPECDRRLNKYTAFLCNHINGGDKKKLEFFEGGRYSFDLEDLLKASAEVLGKGSIGTSYKATLEEGKTTVVVKRLRDVTVSRKEFQQQMKVLGKLKNENVFPLRAFYFSEDEKMLVSDYMPAGSLSTLLHGAGSPIDWVTRKEIALSAAKGLAYLHERGNIVHGNIKASNILLKQDNNHEACLSDYGLNPLFSNSTPLNHGYCAPEVLETRKVTFKSDVYSYGVLLLELITRKSPNQASLGDEGIDLPRWVQSVVREEWTPEVFDVELMRDHNVEDDFVQVLQIGMSCVAMVPDQRPTMADVVMSFVYRVVGATF